MPRGFCGIGIIGSKTEINVGTLWRSANSLGASFIFTAGKRYVSQSSDTMQSWKHIPFFQYENIEELFKNIPKGCIPIAVELDEKARPLKNYIHPERAIYLLGAEDSGLSRAVLDRCRDIIQLPGSTCLNVAVAGSIILYDRVAKNSK